MKIITPIWLNIRSVSIDVAGDRKFIAEGLIWAQKRGAQQNSRDHFTDDPRLADLRDCLSDCPGDQDNQNDLDEQDSKRTSQILVESLPDPIMMSRRPGNLTFGRRPFYVRPAARVIQMAVPQMARMRT
jgi:hypothetical protein